MPFTVANILCSFVTNMSEDLQKELLGLVSTGHSFIEIQSKNFDLDVFSSYPVTVDCVLNSIHRHIESLRKIWPEENKIHSDMTNQIIRQVFILKRHLRLLFSFAVGWTIPELWNCWKKLQSITVDIIEFLISSAKAVNDRCKVSQLLCVLLVQLRWTISKLNEIQTYDVCGNS